MIYGLFLLAIVVQCGYAVYFFARIFRLPATAILDKKSLKPVSIIICAKNEGANLRKNLHKVLTQNYLNAEGKPNYEVIVVNDGSDDDTAQVLQELEQQYDHLWDVPVALDAVRTLQGKKFGLSKGVAHAAHELLVLTDADCVPVSSEWLGLMVAPLVDGKEIVAGYGGYHSSAGLLNAFIRWETLHTWIQYSTYAAAGLPYMAVGRNMACTKSVLLQAQQNELWNVLPSGDDDMLVRIAGNADNMATVADSAAFTHSDTKSTWGEWIKQKQRHLSTGKYYKGKIKALLGVYAVSHAAAWIGFVILLYMGCMQEAIGVMVVRCLFFWIIWAAAAVRLREKTLILFFPFFDIAWLIYNFAFLPYITWKNKKQWT